MKKSNQVFIISILIVLSTTGFSQQVVSVCNNFESNINRVFIDTASIWQIGEVNKVIFDSAYSATNSIITDTTQPYPNNDTSIFYINFQDQWGGISRYLGLYSPLVVEFDHRYLTSSVTDFGLAEYSFDNGNSWFQLFNDTYNIDYESNDNTHFFEGTGNTISDSITVSGNSMGWVHSRISKNIEQLIHNTNPLMVDSIIVKFTFITDSVDGNDGWQIDNLCVSMDQISGTNEFIEKIISITPNPNNGSFSLTHQFNHTAYVSIYNLIGKMVFYEIVNTDKIDFNLDFAPGIYFLKIESLGVSTNSKLVIN